MELIVTKDVGRNLKAGTVYDYPLTTWKNIEKSAGKALKSFTRRLDEVPSLLERLAK